jgi:hypothetical protein
MSGKETICNTVSVSHTIMTSVEDTGSDLMNSEKKQKNLKVFV